MSASNVLGKVGQFAPGCTAAGVGQHKPVVVFPGDSVDMLSRHDDGSNGSGAAPQKPAKGRAAAAAKRQAAGAEDDEDEDDAGEQVFQCSTLILWTTPLQSGIHPKPSPNADLQRNLTPTPDTKKNPNPNPKINSK